MCNLFLQITQQISISIILQFEAEYEEIDTRVQDSIVERTQCLPPCSYTEYKLAAEPKKFEPNYKFYLQLSS